MNSVTVTSAELIAAVKRVIPHTAAANQYLPVLECIRFEVRGGYLTLSATDRFTLIETRIGLSVEVGEDDSFVFLANAKRLKDLLPAFKAGRLVTVTDGGEFNSIHVPGNDGDFPAVNKLWPDRFMEVSPHRFGLGVEHVKKLAALPQGRDEKRIPLVFGQGPDAGERKPLVVVFSDHTRVLVMPRGGEDAYAGAAGVFESMNAPTVAAPVGA
ncbi:hypothetical protein GCM10009700_27610 [Brevibacterium sanguinis]|uniref:hypothetical protein n=1 Tax=Brevibacterium sanguinis TaxID=232444 RepID=UPI0031D2FA5D